MFEGPQIRPVVSGGIRAYIYVWFYQPLYHTFTRMVTEVTVRHTLMKDSGSYGLAEDGQLIIFKSILNNIN